ncbi:MAG: acetyl-CoA carboxylase biotin carboxylase subunit [Actinobacteria bacterium]|nr:MAG: acetyl-CoA carboxylase biotin carboxylase subunit [Actinomycetota bacterium]
MFTRVLVANRGEIAVRVIRALHELGVEAVAVYSTADAGALHTRIADRAVCIGPPSAAESYLNIASVIAAGETTGCEAVHPGYGFLSENPDFVHACEDNDLVFVGPDADVMARMGDKVEAKRELAAAGVPLVPGTEVVGPGEARSAAADLGYPVFLKAAAGGGGKGMRLVERAEDFDEAFARAAAEAEAAFGDGNLYLEKLVVPARHVEIQVLCDADGGVLTLGERECSIQRRHQKLIEESPSPAVGEATREAMEDDVERAARAIAYLNAGTFEFLLAPDGSYYFIELNARLQVEHPVTELVTGVDLVREQLRIADGRQLHQTGRAARRGHAIEVRLNAEDPARGFAPAPGVIERFRPPLGAGVRFDTHIEEGAVIPPHYDSLMAKLIVWDEDRATSIERCLRALGDLELRGVPTTREAALEIVASDSFRSGNYSTGFLDETELSAVGSA